MANSNVNAGNVTWNLDIEKTSFDKKLQDSKSEVSGLSGVFNNVSDTVLSFGAKIANIGWDGLEIGASTTAGILTALGIKGITSANQLQSLQLSMNGLTHSMQLGSQAMATAYTYAQSAPFQLPEVAGTTKSLLAYGIQVAKISGYLQTLGNVSITTGVPIGALGDIFGRVSAQGHLMWYDIQQLTQNGVAILPALEKELGKTATQVQTMATAGQISFDQFNTAMQSLVDPSILQQLNNTMPRQLDRLGGSIRIISNAFVGVGVDATNGFTQASNGIAQAATNLIGNVATSLRANNLTSALSSAGTVLAPLINGIVPYIPTIVNGFAAIVSHISKLGPLLLGVIPLAAGGFGKLASDIPVVGKLLETLDGPLGIVIGLFGTLLASSPELRSALGTAFGILADTLKSLSPTLTVIGKLFSQLLDSVGGALGTVVVALAQAIGQLLTALLPLVPILLQFAIDIIQKVLVPILPSVIQIVQALVGVFSQLLTAIIPLLQPLTSLVILILQQVLLPIMPLVVKLIQLFAQVITEVLTAITPLLPQIFSLISLLIRQLAPVLPQLVNLFIQLVIALLPLLPPLLQLVEILLPPLVSLLTVLANVISAVLVAAITIIIGLISDWIKVVHHIVDAWVDVLTWFDHSLETIKTIFHGIKDAAGDMVGDVVQWFQQLPSKILSAIGYLGSLLYNAGSDLIHGLLNGADSVLEKIGSFFLDKLPGWIKDPFKKALGIHSPSTLFAGYGQNIVQGLANGINDSQNIVGQAVAGLSDQLTVNSALTSSGSLGGPTATITPLTSSSSHQPQVHIHLNQSGIVARSRSEWRDVMKDGINAVNEELKARRLPLIGNGALSGRSTG